MSNNRYKNMHKFYDLLCNGTSFVNLKITIKELNDLKKFYANNYDKYQTFNDFENSNPKMFNILKKSSSAYLEVKKQFQSNMGLQPCVLTECFIAQTIADLYGLNLFADLDDPNASVPIHLTNLMSSYQGYRDNSSFRYVFYDDTYQKALIQFGDCSTIDAVFVDYRSGIRLEFKEEHSKLREIDIRDVYGEDGKLIISKTYRDKYPEYVPFIELFNDTTNIFDVAGHNWNISSVINKATAEKVFDAVLHQKIIDVYVMLKGDKLYPVLSSFLYDNADLSTSEIRPAGRNKRKLFTPEYAKKIINSLGGTIINDKVTVPYDKSNETTGRGLNKVTRYKLSPLIFVHYEDILIQNNEVSFDFDKIFQLVPSVSVHLKTKVDIMSCLEQLTYLATKKNS